MGTEIFGCGCSITYSTFGGNDIIHAISCLNHSSHVSKELKALADKIRSLQKANQNGTNARTNRIN
jgi:hypothetical protein